MENNQNDEFEFTARNQLSFLSRILSNNVDFIGKRENDGSLTSEDAMSLIRLNMTWKKELQRVFQNSLEKQHGQ